MSSQHTPSIVTQFGCASSFVMKHSKRNRFTDSAVIVMSCFTATGWPRNIAKFTLPIPPWPMSSTISISDDGTSTVTVGAA